ncbi:MAG: RNB domain-containing ribonuclease [Parachlamydiaceae bacterium]|nr:RNB domain-containing ribonuclease [Parachlamydiaceae bacterium]
MDAYERLRKIAYRVMLEKGLAPDFPQAVFQQLAHIDQPADFQESAMRDLSALPWCSIDNDDSMDLDQLTFAEKVSDDKIIVYVAIADVNALVKSDSPIDLHAQINTTSVYTAARIFPMLPEKLSTDLTSLNENVGRVSVVFEITLDSNIEVLSSQIYKAWVFNHAKLAYSSVGKWLEGKGPMPEKIGKVPGLSETIKLQNEIAQKMKQHRQAFGALSLETRELKPVFDSGNVSSLAVRERNLAHELIESLMIAANTASARYAIQKKIPSLRRIVRVPKRWDRIVMLANEKGKKLPEEPDSKALDVFLNEMRKKEPETFPDLSLVVIKLLGSGEYVVWLPGEDPVGHFGLALRNYTHSTAPNRRYPDVITQRLIEASLLGKKTPYTVSELESLAAICTQREDAAAKVERQVSKSAAAMLLASRIGEEFKALITGVGAKGTWVRLIDPPVEGKLVSGANSYDVGDKIEVKLVDVDIDKGFIDFVVA